MFGIKKKLYFTITVILSILAVVLLVLTLVGVFSDKSLMYLTVIALALGALAAFITPSSKKMKVVEGVSREVRGELYGALETKPKDFDEIVFVEKNNTLELKGNEKIKIDGLNYEESLYIFKRLIKDYVIILYSEMVGNKINMKKAMIPSFKMIIEREDSSVEEILIVSDYQIL